MNHLSLDEHIFSQRLLSPSRASDSGRPSCTMVKILPSLHEWLLLQCPIPFVDITHAPELHANPTLQCRLMKLRCPVRLHTSGLKPDSSPRTTTSVAAHRIVPQLAPSSRVNQYECAPHIQHLEKVFTAPHALQPVHHAPVYVLPANLSDLSFQSPIFGLTTETLILIVCFMIHLTHTCDILHPCSATISTTLSLSQGYGVLHCPPRWQ